MSELISVVVTAYNKQDSIKACLDSVINQTYRNLEILVVYLDSADNTLEIINSFNDARIKIIYQPEKTGPGGARNLGIEAAQGKYIGFVEADDTIDLDFYEKLYASIKKYDSDIAMADIIIPGTGSQKILYKHNKEKVLTSFKDKYGLLKNGASFDKLFKANLIKTDRFQFPEKACWEDNPWLLGAIFYSNKLSIVCDTYYYYNWKDKTPERVEFLKKDVIPMTRLMLEFANKNLKEKSDINLVKKKALDDVVGLAINDDQIYKELIKLFGFFLPLYKKRFKKYRRDFFRFSFREKYLMIFGIKIGKSK